jgi:hypothetical protein
MDYDKRRIYDLQNIASKVEDDMSMLSNQINVCIDDNGADLMRSSFLQAIKNEYHHVEYYFENVQKLIDATIKYVNKETKG